MIVNIKKKSLSSNIINSSKEKLFSV